MCGSALVSKLVPVPASVGRAHEHADEAHLGVLEPQVSTMRLSAALVAVYTPMPGHAGPMLETDDR